jgi:general secretion pathway protein D
LPSAGFKRSHPDKCAGTLPVRPLLRNTAALFLLACAGPILAGCTTPSASIEAIDQVDLTAKTPKKVTNRGEGAVLKTKAKHGRYELFPAASVSPLQDGAEPAPGVGAQDDGTFTVNINQASIAEAAKLILGETLGYNYILDPRVQGSITLVSNRPLTARELLNSFEAALRLALAALVQTDNGYKVVALQEVNEGETGTADIGTEVSAGYGVSAIPLRHISPQTLLELTEAFIARGGSVRASRAGNLILVRGTAEERRSLVEIILSFDVDWMKTQTASMAILENGRADDVAAKIQAVFAEDTALAGTNALKVIPVPRLNGLIVIANSQEKVRRAVIWIKRLDQESLTEPNFYVYAVQNGNAVELAKILQATFGEGEADAGATAEVAPDRETTDVSMDAGQASASQDPAQPQAGQTQDGGDGLGSGITTGSAPQEETAATSSLANGTRITPNPANNTLVIRATPKEYRRIQAMLRQIDAPAVQVMINTTIAEVSLNEELRYGVQAYLKGKDVAGGFFGQSEGSLTLKPNLPGMNFLVGRIADPRLVIDALSGITNVRIVSSPSLMVMENETATIKVGDQVPVKGEALVNDGVTTESFDFKETGVILKVKPRVSANGTVTIDLGQELTAVKGVTTKEGENPTFSQRTINSKVAVNDQQTVLLGGLISGQEDGDRDTVPGANKVPLLGDLVGTTLRQAKRTELIVFITPKIIRNGEEAASESQELRDKMKNLTFN